jgi:hypothetical protein
MYTENSYAQLILCEKSTSASGATTGGTAVDMGPYFNVGRREVKFLVGYIANATIADDTVTVTLEECASTATASFTSVLGVDGSTGTWTSTAAASSAFEFNAVLNYRYVRAKYNGASTSSGGSYSVMVAAIPIRRQS